MTVITGSPDFLFSKNYIMFTAASTTAVLATAFADTGSIVTVVVAAIVVGVIALMGLAFGMKKVSKYITGRKF